ncbi:MAG: DUF3810 domain-containing protein [Bacillota bacterium]|nr:DUF3810 domain-containing protein [Bacillota bacterium]
MDHSSSTIKSKRTLSKPTWILSAVLPILLILLLGFLKAHPKILESIFHRFTIPVRSALTQLTSPIPFSLTEILWILLVFWSILHIIRGFWSILKKKEKGPALFIRMARVAILGLWLLAGLSWLWNIGYYVPGLPEALHLERGDISDENLEQTALYFAGILIDHADDIRRNEAGLFDHQAKDFFPEAPTIYDPLEQAFPVLKFPDANPKKLLLPKVQSYMGFSGFYSPFTGEANINTDIPLSSQPFTIAHEMAHQRFVASKDEADFLGVIACLSSGRPIYVYSGALAGLKMLAGPLGATDPQAWSAIAETLPAEVAADWNSSIEYWAQFKTPLEEWSGDVYDTYLRSQDQELGIRSYGACVDLLVNYYSSDILVNPYSE